MQTYVSFGFKVIILQVWYEEIKKGLSQNI